MPNAILSKLGRFSFHNIACHCAGWLVHDCVHRPKGGSGVDPVTTASAAEVSCHSVFFCHAGVDLPGGAADNTNDEPLAQANVPEQHWAHTYTHGGKLYAPGVVLRSEAYAVTCPETTFFLDSWSISDLMSGTTVLHCMISNPSGVFRVKWSTALQRYDSTAEVKSPTTGQVLFKGFTLKVRVACGLEPLCWRQQTGCSCRTSCARCCFHHTWSEMVCSQR